MIVTIPGELPTMNEIIAASKNHWSRYAKMKKEFTEKVAIHAGMLPKVEKADFTIVWYCKSRRQDKDNIMAGQKFIFDGLVSAGVLENDGWKQIGDVAHVFKVDKEHPRVEIYLENREEIRG